MKGVLLASLVSLVIGAAAGFAAGILAFPFLFPPPPVNEVVTGKAEGEIVATGSFLHADPSDPLHYGRGAVTVYANLVHLEQDFEVGPGPKYHVYLVPVADVTPDTDVEQTMFVDLGRLKAFSGGQNYAVPAGVDVLRFGSVVIWCEQFGVLISPAALTPVAGQ